MIVVRRAEDPFPAVLGPFREFDEGCRIESNDVAGERWS